MARKYCNGATSRLLILIVAALIMLSAAAVVTESGRQCYWCGPLAEQVHRSRRAPPCDARGDQLTHCEPDFPHCAVVATSPPYVESRLCVKLYQDECYPLYCNSTKTWRMTCPCQGNLCNGPNTEREINAFSILPELVTKTNKRINKRTQKIVPVKFIPNDNEKTLVITNISAMDHHNDTFNYNYETSKQTVTDIFISEESLNFIDNNIESSVESTENALNDNNNKFLTDNTKTANVDNDTVTEFEDMITKELLFSITTETPTAPSKPNKPSTHREMVNEPKPSEELPTAEALQQNASPMAVNEKSTSPTTINTDTTYQTTLDDNVEESTEHSITKKNNGVRIYTDVILWAINFCIICIIC